MSNFIFWKDTFLYKFRAQNYIQLKQKLSSSQIHTNALDDAFGDVIDDDLLAYDYVYTC
jgi:hypothetical protein